jgi:hypothetical protein
VNKRNCSILIKTVLLTLSGILVTGCPAGKPPRFDGKWWAGDSSRSSIRRAQESEEIKCESEAFDDYTCLTYEHLKLLYQTYVLGCAKWKKDLPKVSEDEFKAMLKDPVLLRAFLGEVTSGD